MTTLSSTVSLDKAAAPVLDDDLDRAARQRRRIRGLYGAGGALLVMVVASIAFGSKSVPLDQIPGAFLSYDHANDFHVIVRGQRVPRTVLAIMVGAALAVSGGLMQGLTRNPLADPGLLGVSAGASFAMTLAIAFLSVSGVLGLVWFSFAGAVLATLVVYALGATGRGGGSPVTLALAGVAIGAVLSGLTQSLVLINPRAFISMRLWQTGALADRGWDVIVPLLPFVLAGLVLAALAARGLNAVALGADLAASLGSNQRQTRITVVVAVTLLCGAATVAIGPVWFVGLMVPYVARWIVGPDQRWILAYSVVIGPVLLLSADIIGRLLVRPDELQAGLVTAFVGGPGLIWLIRRTKLKAL